MGSQNSFVKVLVTVAVIGFLGYFIVHDLNIFGFPVTREVAGIPAPTLHQTTGQASLGKIDGYKVTVEYMYSCDLRGLVVNERHFHESSVLDKAAPVSAVLAWGVVAENNKKIDFGWQQPIRGGLTWNGGEERYAAIGGSDVIRRNCTDAFLVPADSSVREAFRKIKQGDYLHLTGYVGDLYCRKPDGDTTGWGTGDLAKSLTGESDDMHSVLYVTKIEWVK